MGSIKFFTSIVMVALFSLAIVIYGINFAEDNGSAISLSNDSYYSTYENQISYNLTNLDLQTENSSNTFMATTQDQGDQSASSGGQFKGGISATLRLMYTILDNSYKKIFGEDSSGFGIFLTAITSILGFMAIAYAWKYWKGSPD